LDLIWKIHQPTLEATISTVKKVVCQTDPQQTDPEDPFECTAAVESDFDDGHICENKRTDQKHFRREI
jgi:hypothetical protein